MEATDPREQVDESMGLWCHGPSLGEGCAELVHRIRGQAEKEIERRASEWAAGLPFRIPPLADTTVGKASRRTGAVPERALRTAIHPLG